jgi:hypothetical protein
MHAAGQKGHSPLPFRALYLSSALDVFHSWLHNLFLGMKFYAWYG